LEASAIFTTIGAGAWLALADAERARLGRRRARDDSLTPTEEEVVRLAAAGATNSQMATAMHVSPKTIEAHLTRIYRKLGIRSRAELGALVGAGRLPSTVDPGPGT
jgi:DNA-binding CsgD family transcriptional regulator